MRIVLLLAVAVALAGCTASGEDPFAYTKKPLYAGGFDLARIAGTTDSQEFRVTDGSIAGIDVRVWINATAGGAHVKLINPSGAVAYETSATDAKAIPMELGVWRVEVDAPAGSAGILHILATRT